VRSTRVLIAVSAALALMAGASVAVAAGGSTAPSSSPLTPGATTSPFSPGLPQAGATTPTSSTPTIISTGNTGAAGSSGLSGSGIVLIVVGALVLLVGIAYFIWRDARRRAPVKTGTRGGSGGLGDDERRAPTGSKRQQKPRKLSPAERRRRKRGRAR
jgi:lipoprotein signal peptidase